VQVKTNFYLDIAVFVLFLAGYEPSLTGRTVHEWWNLAIAGVLIAHLVMHWDWMVAVSLRLFKESSNSARINYVIDLMLLVVFVMMILSGLMISKSVLSIFGLQSAPRSVWRELHSTFGNLLLFLVGLHIAFHWKWIAGAWERHFASYLKRRRRQPVVCG
jgi:cytochrome b561